MTDDISAHLRRFLPEQAPEPRPAERFDAWLADAPDDDVERWRVRSRPSDQHT